VYDLVYVQMALFIWEDGPLAHTSGMVCVLARSEKQAWKMLYEKDNLAWWSLQGEPTSEIKGESYSESGYSNVPKCGYFKTAIRPKKITKQEAFVAWGR